MLLLRTDHFLLLTLFQSYNPVQFVALLFQDMQNLYIHCSNKEIRIFVNTKFLLHHRQLV